MISNLFVGSSLKLYTADQKFWSAVFLLVAFWGGCFSHTINVYAIEVAPVDGDMVIPAVRAETSVLLDIVSVRVDDDSRLVAVGDRGHILLSDDSGASWRQSLDVPTRALLTSVTAAGNRLWAVGHDSTILTSSDSGESWSMQYSDIGGDPLLAVHFDAEGNGYAVGAYGLYMQTGNAGTDWDIYLMNELLVEEQMPVSEDSEEAVDHAADDDHGFIDQSALDDYEDDDVDYHLNEIIRINNTTLLVAAEAGRGYYSNDNGAGWQQFRLPYDGSMFTAYGARNGQCIVVLGLRGNAFRACNDYIDWRPINTGVNASLFGVADAGSGRIWVAGANGTLLRMSSDGQQVEQIPLAEGDDLSSLLVDGDYIVLLGESGLQRIAISEL